MVAYPPCPAGRGSRCCSLEPPPLSVARSFFVGLEANVRHLERKKAQQYRNTAKAARRNDPSLIFRDLQEPLAQSVETLLECSAAEVSGLDPADLSITLATDTPFRDDLPLLTKHGPIPVVHAEPDKVWCGSLPDIAVGDLVRQERYLGSLTDIFRAFMDIIMPRRPGAGPGLPCRGWSQPSKRHIPPPLLATSAR